MFGHIFNIEYMVCTHKEMYSAYTRNCFTVRHTGGNSIGIPPANKYAKHTMNAHMDSREHSTHPVHQSFVVGRHHVNIMTELSETRTITLSQNGCSLKHTQQNRSDIDKKKKEEIPSLIIAKCLMSCFPLSVGSL